MRQIDPDILLALESGELRPFYYLDIEIDSTHYRYTSCEIPLIIDGEKYDAKQVETISKLSSKQELIGRLAYVLNAPIQGLVSSLNGIITKLVYVLKAIEDKKNNEK